MTEPQRLFALFKNLYNGHPWIDVTLVNTLNGISAKQAQRRLGNCNTIWEIVVHLTAWRENVLQRVQGQVLKTPSSNYIEPVADTSDAAWAATLQQLEDSQMRWLAFLAQLDSGQLEHIYPTNGMTYYEQIQGIIQHDAYHLGQIVLLAKWGAEAS